MNASVFRSQFLSLMNDQKSLFIIKTIFIWTVNVLGAFLGCFICPSICHLPNPPNRGKSDLEKRSFFNLSQSGWMGQGVATAFSENHETKYTKKFKQDKKRKEE